MSLTNLTLTDGTTPLTFEPFTGQVGNSPAQWLEKSAGTFIGYKSLTLALLRSQGTKGALKTTIAIKFPSIAIVDGVETVKHNSLFNGSYTIPDTMSLSERTAFAKYVSNAIANAIVTAAVVSQSTPT